MPGQIGPEDDAAVLADHLVPMGSKARLMSTSRPLHRPPGFALGDDAACAAAAAADTFADLQLGDVVAPQLAVEGQVEHRAVTHPPFPVEPEPNGPDLLRLERSLGAERAANVPGLAPLGCRIVCGMPHRPSPRLPVPTMQSDTGTEGRAQVEEVRTFRIRRYGRMANNYLAAVALVSGVIAWA